MKKTIKREDRHKSKGVSHETKIRKTRTDKKKHVKNKPNLKRQEKGNEETGEKKWVPPVDPLKVKKYKKDSVVKDKNDLKIPHARKKLESKEQLIAKGTEFTARKEILLAENEGFLTADSGEVSQQFKQSDIQESVDAISAAKRFDLDLREFGPYRIDYIRNGRHLLIGGRKGHVAAFDWITKTLKCEMNVMEGVYDVAWLHQETMFAVAQKQYTYIYDNTGIELHCLKKLGEVVKLEFLPYHFLLATVNSSGFLNWLDVSIGEIVSTFHVKARGTAATIAQNPCNAHLCIGEPTGVVSFWSPNCKKPVVTKWCHKQPLAAVAFDPKGVHFATAGIDRSLKIWDARNLQGPMNEMTLRTSPRNMAFSQTGLLALAFGNNIDILRDYNIYLRHTVPNSIDNMQFCPFEDVLGIGHGSGLSSILVPGAGEPNIDALEINPFQSKSQRKEAEVKALLNKIPVDLITWDPRQLQSVHTPSLEAIIESKSQLLHVKKPDVKFTPKKKRGRVLSTFKRKIIVKDGMKQRYFEEVKQRQKNELEHVDLTTSAPAKKKTVLDRFVKPKKVIVPFTKNKKNKNKPSR